MHILRFRLLWPTLLFCSIGIVGCAVNNNLQAKFVDDLAAANRLSWGVNDSLVEQVKQQGIEKYLAGQLHPSKAVLPDFVNEQIASMQITQKPVDELVKTAVQLHREKKESKGQEVAEKDYQAYMSGLARETEQRFFLRAVYSPNQLEEQMVWFWLNHFSIYARKHDLRARMADYEDRAIRPYALGKFGDLLKATVYHPAMLLYLDNANNKKDHINENYARELMELHTLGVDAGYTQDDVQNLAKILTGLGVVPARQLLDLPAMEMHKNKSNKEPKKSPAAEMPNKKAQQKTMDTEYAGVQFDEKRHLGGAKTLLGKTIQASGRNEIDQAISMLSKHPATAKFISSKLGGYFLGQAPSTALLEKMTAKFLASEGDIPSVLQVLFLSPEFNSSLNQAFKDPLHYVVSSARILADDQPIARWLPFVNQLNKLDQLPFGRQTPDGYPMQASYWNGSGQMVARFDAAQQFVQRDPKVLEKSSAVTWYLAKMNSASRSPITEAKTPKEKMQLFLSSPEFMLR